MTIGERIQYIRVKNNLSQDAFGELIGTTRQSVSKWERDQTLPELEKIVKIARLFGVTTDSLLLDGISTFADEDGDFVCCAYRSSGAEIVLTERFALHYYETGTPRRIGCRLYTGNRVLKSCIAAAEYDFENDTTSAAGIYESGERWQYGINQTLAETIGTEFPEKSAAGMKVTETFASVPADRQMPTVSEIGISSAIRLWRMGAEYENSGGMCRLHLCTAETEYIFQIRPNYGDIYIGASWNISFELGLFGGQQYFRIRDTNERQPYCGFGADFSSHRRNIKIPTDKAAIGQCILTDKGYMWCVKRYDDDEIVLEGCGGDEYTYSRYADFCERYDTVNR